MNEWTLGRRYLASPADYFAGADDITMEREPGIEIIERTPLQGTLTKTFESHGRQPEDDCFHFWRGFAPHHGQEKLLLMTVA